MVAAESEGHGVWRLEILLIEWIVTGHSKKVNTEVNLLVHNARGLVLCIIYASLRV